MLVKKIYEFNITKSKPIAETYPKQKLKVYCKPVFLRFVIIVYWTRKKEQKKNVNTHNYGQWIDVEKDLLVIKPHTIYFVTNFDKF